jgi:type II secretory pathway pseudopilin PulG
MNPVSEKGFSLTETVIALGVLATGVIGAAGVLVTGMSKVSSSPANLNASQKAAQAVESVFAARDSKRLTWNQIRNASAGGVFLDGPQPLKLPGNDGLVNTADDGALETFDASSSQSSLGSFTREIKIEDITSENGQLRKITVTITYPGSRPYILSTYISSFA